jgi:carbon-monoxide dehydrogenase large subunit
MYAAVQGLGGAFMEDLVYDANGQLLAGSLADYSIPIATDFPRIRAISLERRPSPTNPLGVKGAGEGALSGWRADRQCDRRSVVFARRRTQ